MSALAFEPLRRRTRHRPGSRAAAVAAAGLAVVVAVALLAPLLAPSDPDAVDLSAALQGPSSAHLLGTDASGRDLLSRLLFGARTALVGPLLVVAVAAPAGIALALLSAWLGGWRDLALSRLLDLLYAFPGLLLAILATAAFGVGLLPAAIALGVAYVPYVARVVRAEALRQYASGHVEAARAVGASGWRLATREVLPGVLPLAATQTAIAFGYATVDVAAMSFLGLGVQIPRADWGSMAAAGQGGLRDGHPAETLLAGGALALTVLAVFVLADRVSARDGR